MGAFTLWDAFALGMLIAMIAAWPRFMLVVFLIGLAFSKPSSGEQLGMVPGCPDGSCDYLAEIDYARNTLRADPLMTYVEWTDFHKPYKRLVMDRINDGGRGVVNVSLTRAGGGLGSYPIPALTLDDPIVMLSFASDFTAFVKATQPAFACVGNEVNTRLNRRPDEVDSFLSMLTTVKLLLGDQTTTRLCVVLSFRDSVKDNHVLAKRIAERGFLLVWTVYGYTDPDFQFGNPSEGIAWLDRVERESPKPYAISETGWNTSPALGGTEQEQAEFYRLLRLRTSSSVFTLAFMERDGKDCTALATKLAGTDPPPNRLMIFDAFLCHFGIRRANGTTKLAAWEVARAR
jgi:hypothetical protein